jgi:FtsP/CotA-like multicopper oxidase with cupredoxin domain
LGRVLKHDFINRLNLRMKKGDVIKLNRREFLNLASLGLTGSCIGLKAIPSLAGMGGGVCGGGGGMGGGGTSIIDPPPDAAFADPRVLLNESLESCVVEISIEAKVAPINVNGTVANLLTYNGFYPAPTMKVRKGDLLRVNLKNSLSMLGTNILGHDRDITSGFTSSSMWSVQC